MRISGKKHINITLIDDNSISFIFLVDNKYNLLKRLSHDQFLSIDKNSDVIPEESMDSRLNILILPDYWIEHISYRFRSRKKSLVEGFIKRKLNSEYSSELPWIADFYEYTFYQNMQGEQEIDVYFPHEPRFFQVYKQLEACNILPDFITSPAFIWEKKLKKMLQDFEAGEKCFINLLQSECFLYFFSKGRFIFSRAITFADSQTEDHDKLEALTYEINQSLHLFSQKAKSETEKIYLLSPNEENAYRLSGMINIAVKDVYPVLGRSRMISKDNITLGSISFFDTDDLLPANKILNIAHTAQKQTYKWKTVQRAGIITGILVFLLTGTESLYLLHSDMFRIKRSQIMHKNDPTPAIVQYNQALDELIMEATRPNPARLVLGFVKSLPENVWIRKIEMEAKSGTVNFTGIIQAENIEKFKGILSKLLDNIKKEIPCADNIKTQDIDIKELNNNITSPQQYMISFGFKVS